MKIENTSVMNLEGAIRGARNPLESWEKSDSWKDQSIGTFFFGQKDIDLMQRLIKAGTSDSKFMRQIMVCMDVTAPMYWWSEFDTYKVATVANSTSKMHKLASTPITMDCFEMDDYEHLDDIVDEKGTTEYWYDFVMYLDELRKAYNDTKDIRYWKELIRLLPESWLQKRTITLDYATLRNQYFQRRNHKLMEWHTYCKWIESLPYAKDLICFE